MTLAAEYAEFRARATVGAITVAGQRWGYALGPGPAARAILLLPGGLNSHAAFFPLLRALGDDRRVVAVQYPTVDTLEALLDGLWAFLDAAGLARVAVLGTSLGGAVAQCLVRQRPERVESLVLAQTFAPNPAVRARMLRNALLIGWLPAAIVGGLVQRRILGLLAALPPDERAIWRGVLAGQFAAAAAKRWLRCQYRLLGDYCARRFAPGDLREWPGRVLIAQSEDDPLVARLAGVPLASLYPGAAVRTIRAGHLALLTARAEYASVVVPFLREAA